MHRQHVYDQVAKRILSYETNREPRYYDTDTGRKDPIGALIPSRFYHPKMEGETIESVLVACPALARYLDATSKADRAFLGALQRIYDGAWEPNEWADELRRFAVARKLRPIRPELPSPALKAATVLPNSFKRVLH